MTAIAPEAAVADVDAADADYHVYELRLQRANGERLPYRVATCDGDALAFTLTTLHDEGQLTEDSVVGILYRPDGEAVGTWLVNPWSKGRTT